MRMPAGSEAMIEPKLCRNCGLQLQGDGIYKDRCAAHRGDIDYVVACRDRVVDSLRSALESSQAEVERLKARLHQHEGRYDTQGLLRDEAPSATSAELADSWDDGHAEGLDDAGRQNSPETPNPHRSTRHAVEAAISASKQGGTYATALGVGEQKDDNG